MSWVCDTTLYLAGGPALETPYRSLHIGICGPLWYQAHAGFDFNADYGTR